MIKRVCETIKNESKEQKNESLAMLFGALAASVLGSALAGKGVMRGYLGW